jgi:hypothetical protein
VEPATPHYGEDHDEFRASWRTFLERDGYMAEYPVARAWADARVSRIYGGASAIMREIVGRSLALDGRR